MADEYGKTIEAIQCLNRTKENTGNLSCSDALEAAASSFAATAEVAKTGKFCEISYFRMDGSSYIS
jgi:hypothetical protein